MLENNYFIINRKARSFESMKIAGKTAVFIGSDGRVADYGVISLGTSVYAALYCDKARNISLVTDRSGRYAVTSIIWYTEEGYLNGMAALREAVNIRFSEQNLQINRYAEAIAEKLKNGVRLMVTDAVRESDMVTCPECGILNPRGSLYCLDCGAEIETEAHELSKVM